ncbi:MAG: hypothetical protein HXX09_04605 [Bacteroidetes bacterium]|nr:hypothetical protein [Bacteroidota bacterium]
MKSFTKFIKSKIFKSITSLKFLLFFFIPIFTILIIGSCKHDQIYPDVCFETEVQPIFLANCAISGCHDATRAEGGYVLTDYSNIMNKGIKSGNASGSKIYKAISGNILAESMPPSGPLTTEQITLIRSWIESGAKSGNCNTSSCDTNLFSFSLNVKPIFDTYCVGCHKSGSSSNINFDGYSNIKAYLDVSGNVTKIIQAVQYTSASSMPKTGKMIDCKITQMVKWINAGYANN